MNEGIQGFGLGAKMMLSQQGEEIAYPASCPFMPQPFLAMIASGEAGRQGRLFEGGDPG